jgi:hypothetical protein
VFVIGAAGCTIEEPAATAPPQQLVQVEPEPAGSNCANGGDAIETGLDRNGDGVLEPDEVTSTVYDCAASPLPPPSAAPSQLIVVEPEPAGSNCAYGGAAIETGLDTNRDGVLETSEVTATSYVCVAAPAANELVDVVPAPVAECPDGGQAIEVGPDSNLNGVLDPDEIAYTSYLCSTTGSGVALVDIETVGPGSHCAGGGEAIEVGVDTNHDGVLEPSEVTSTSFVCTPVPPGTVIQGDVVIHDQADVDALAGATSITGTLTVDSTTVTAIRLPALTSVGGFMCAGDGTAPCTLVTLALPGLRTVENTIAVDDYHLTTFDLSQLHDANQIVLSNMSAVSLPSFETCSTGDFFFTADSAPSVIALPALATCNLDLTWTGPSIDLSSFTSGRLQIDEGSTTTLALPAMTTGDVDISDTSIAELDIPRLATGSVFMTADAITTIDVSALTTGWLGFQDDKQLTSVTVSPDASISQLLLINDHELPTCAAMAVWNELGRPPGEISNNDDAGTCP